jgi:lipopolysaccharide/colanic/teichoic acid biosynthesis glycosyltransferase
MQYSPNKVFVPKLPEVQREAGDPASNATQRRPVYAFTKRTFDIVFALTLLVIAAPVLAVVAILVRATSPGAVLFRQDRVGKDGKLFTCYKFRTMRTDAERVLANDPRLSDEFRRSWKLINDPRVTSVGKWLRKTSIDEVPQLFNVLRGDMSVVGPRPVQPKELREQFGAMAKVVMSVKPGLTSLWSVSGRSLLSYEQRIAIEVEYVNRRGFLLDLVVVLLTVPAVLTGRGAV